MTNNIETIENINPLKKNMYREVFNHRDRSVSIKINFLEKPSPENVLRLENNIKIFLEGMKEKYNTTNSVSSNPL